MCLGNRVLGGLSTNEERRREMEDSLGKKEKAKRGGRELNASQCKNVRIWRSVHHTVFSCA